MNEVKTQLPVKLFLLFLNSYSWTCCLHEFRMMIMMMMIMMMMMMNCFCGMSGHRNPFVTNVPIVTLQCFQELEKGCIRNKCVKLYFPPGRFSEFLTIANLRHSVRRILTSAEPEFRLCLIKLCSNDNHYTIA